MTPRELELPEEDEDDEDITVLKKSKRKIASKRDLIQTQSIIQIGDIQIASTSPLSKTRGVIIKMLKDKTISDYLIFHSGVKKKIPEWIG